MNTSEIEALLRDMVEGYLRRAGIADADIASLTSCHGAATAVARWLAQQAPKLLDDHNLDDCPVEL